MGVWAQGAPLTPDPRAGQPSRPRIPPAAAPAAPSSPHSPAPGAAGRPARASACTLRPDQGHEAGDEPAGAAGTRRGRRYAGARTGQRRNLRGPGTAVQRVGCGPAPRSRGCGGRAAGEGAGSPPGCPQPRPRLPGSAPRLGRAPRARRGRGTLGRGGGVASPASSLRPRFGAAPPSPRPPSSASRALPRPDYPWRARGAGPGSTGEVEGGSVWVSAATAWAPLPCCSLGKHIPALATWPLCELGPALPPL